MTRKYPGKFIVFEGTDGCGKSTQCEMLYHKLLTLNIDTVRIREPGGTELGEKIRKLIMNTPSITGTTELLLFNAARSELIAQTIIPALLRGAVVLCDRFFYSTIVYQGIRPNIDTASIIALNDLFFSDLTPDLTFVFDVTVDICMKRVRTRSESANDHNANNRFDPQLESEYENIIRLYRKLAELYAANTVLINGSKSPISVYSNVKKILNNTAVLGFDL